MDLYFAGGISNKITQEEIINKGNNRLFSGLTERPAINAYIEYIKQNKIENKGKLFIDSGAFTAWTRGKEIDVEEYINFINDRADYIYIYGQIDSIPGNRTGGLITPQQVKEAAQKTWENYLYMRTKMKNPNGLLYTFHVGEPFEFLERALNWQDDKGNKMVYIALGGMVGKPKTTRDSFLDKCFKIIKSSSNPNVKVHAFGMTDFDLLEKYPITSADSTSALMTGALGNISTSFGNIAVSENQENDFASFCNMNEDAQQIILKEIEELKMDMKSLSTDYNARITFNIRAMSKRALQLQQKNYKPKARLF